MTRLSSFLIVEDEPLLQMLLEDMLAELGHSVIGKADAVIQGRNLARSLEFDAAILDVNLRGEQSFPIADVLLQRGRPFMFATGYGRSAPAERFVGVPVIGKPFLIAELADAISKSLGEGHTT